MPRYRKYLIGLLCCFSLHSHAEDMDEEMLRARAAYDKKDAIALSEYTSQLKAENYILAPYAEYWLLLLNMDDTPNQEIDDFLINNSVYPFANRLRGEYLKKLAKESDWDTFSAEYPNYEPNDAAVACYAVQAKAFNHVKNALVEAKSLWLQPKAQPENCDDLYDQMQQAHVLTEEDIAQRLRMSLAAGQLNLAKQTVKRSQNFDPKYFKLIDTAYSSPEKLFNKKAAAIKTRFDYEIYLYALALLAKKDSELAVSTYENIKSKLNFNNKLTEDEQDYFYGVLAVRAAQRHEHEAIAWFQKLKPETLSNDQIDWYARAALRESNWPLLLTVISQMNAENAAQSRWRYWKARALNATNESSQEANMLLAKLSTERHYYGWLAQDELKEFISKAPVYYQVTSDEVSEVAKNSAIQRAEALQRIGLRWEAKLEWALATKDMNDIDLLAAAEYAMQHQWHDLAIITADKTTEMHDFSLRYPLPYRNLMQQAATGQQIDEAWVYAITRQESRFMHDAKSGVGAAGLMQLMPTTAKWAAPRAGIINYRGDMIHEIKTNIALGTFYLRHTLDLMGDQEVMATAAYNAGPSRARKWMADASLEGAIYAETIPFSETRNYVQKVMANAHLYAQQLGLKNITLKQRMGIVPGKVNVTSSDETVVKSNDNTQTDELLEKP